jgi:hypothetical protein
MWKQEKENPHLMIGKLITGINISLRVRQVTITIKPINSFKQISLNVVNSIPEITSGARNVTDF